MSDFGGAAGSIHQSYSVKEGFIEFGGPILQNKPGAKALIFDAGFRHSDYSTSGPVNTGKFEVQYAPIDDVRFRASYQRAIRAPNLIDLYNPATVGQINSGDDPCAPNEVTGNLKATLAQCERSGVTAAQYNALSVPQGSGSRLSELIGGNVNLKPERATSYNFGVNITPVGLPSLVARVDYFQIKIKDEITTVPPGLLLQGCLNTGNPFFCDRSSAILRMAATSCRPGSTSAAPRPMASMYRRPTS